MSTLEAFAADDLRIAVTEEEALQRFRLVWTGKGNARQPEDVLRPFFERALVEASARHWKLELRFDQLEYLNSSTIAALIKFVQQARKQAVGLVMVYDPKLRWQKLWFDALRIFETGDGMLELRAH